jgi:zinc transport system substrate-binding protein
LIKRYLFVLLLSAMVFLSGCSSVPNLKSSAAPDKLTIVTSFYPIYIMALNITADTSGIELINLTGPQTGCLHDYQLSPDNMKTLQKADIFIVNGAGIESFLDKVIKQQQDLKIITATQGMTLIKGPGQTGPNPHVWVSIAGAIQEVKNINQQLSELDPSHAKQYQKNSDIYIAKLDRLRQEMHGELDNLPNRNMVSFHEAFPYFAQEFNLNIVAVVEHEPGSEPSAKELAQTIEIVRKSKVKALFIEPQYPSGAANTIARETGAGVYTLDPAVTGPNSPDAYLNIMKNNLASLREALR